MHALNNWMNRIDGWRHSVDANGNPRSFFKKEILSRFGTALVGTPLEIAAVAQNIIAAPITAVGVVAKLGVKTVRCVTSAEFFKKLDNALPSLKDFIRTVLRVFAYAIGAFSTATIGFISPDLNFAAHCKVPFLHLAYNKQQQIDQAAVEVQRQRTAEEELKAHEEQALYDTVAKLIEDQQIEEDKKTEEALTEQVIPVISEQVDQEPVEIGRAHV